MEMRIVVPDAAGASALADRLADAFGAERISLHGDRPEVGVRVGRRSDRAVLRVLDTVDGWLDHVGAGFADMRLGTRSYRVAVPAPVETWQRPSPDPFGFTHPGGARGPAGQNGALPYAAEPRREEQR